MKLPALCFCLLVAAAPAPGATSPKRVLFLTHSAGFTHGVVRRQAPDEPSLAEARLIAAAEGRFEITATQDCAAITAENLDRFDAVAFYTTGELPIAADDRDALFDWLRRGGAFVGIHSATDTYYEVPEYGEMIGGYFDGHPWNQAVGVLVEDSDHPATKHLEERFEIADEIYQHRAFSRHPVRVLLRLDPGSVAIEKGKRADQDYALAWCRDYGEGRVFYTTLGHRDEIFADERFMQHLLGGIDWAINGPDYAPPAPAGAVVLFAGTDLSAWQGANGGDAGWVVEGGAVEVKPGAGSIVTRDRFGDCLLHVEFMTPVLPDEVRGQARGNSGVYVHSHYEVQVLDSYGLEPGLDDCGAIYGVRAPAANACRPPGRWQTYDIRFRAPRFDAQGRKTASACLDVWLNGLKIHTAAEVDRLTTAALATPEAPAGPLLLQDHGNRVRYRNIWLLPLAG